MTSHSWRYTGADSPIPKRRDPDCYSSPGLYSSESTSNDDSTDYPDRDHLSLFPVRRAVPPVAASAGALPALRADQRDEDAAPVPRPQLAGGAPMIAQRLTGNRCRCSACGEYFNSVSTFDRHRHGGWQGRGADRRCLSPAELKARGWTLNAHGFWIVRRNAIASVGFGISCIGTRIHSTATPRAPT